MTDQPTESELKPIVLDVQPLPFFSYDPLDAFRFHATAEAAQKEARGALDRYSDDAPDDGWMDEADLVCWGEVRETAVRHSHRVKPVGRPLTEEERSEFGEFDEIWQMRLEATRPAETELQSLRSEVERLNATLDTILKDPDYEGGVQYWIRKFDYLCLISVKLEEQNAELVKALEGLLEHYVTLVNSGDAGNWNPEGEPQVIAARKTLAKTGGAK